MTILELKNSNDINKKNLDLLNKLLNKNLIIFIYSDSCGHCIKFKPEWELFKKGSKYNIIELENDALMELNNSHKNILKKITLSSGLIYFPMILILNNENDKTKKYLYEGDRTSKNIKKFIKEKFKKEEKKNEYLDINKLNSSFNTLINKIAKKYT